MTTKNSVNSAMKMMVMMVATTLHFQVRWDDVLGHYFIAVGRPPTMFTRWPSTGMWPLLWKTGICNLPNPYECILKTQGLQNSLRWLPTWWPTWRCNSWRGKIRLRTRRRGNGKRRSDNRWFLGYWRLRILLWPRKIFYFKITSA